MAQRFEYRTSTTCSEGCGGCCVEVATNLVDQAGMVALRDTKSGTIATFSAAEWRDFVTGVKAGEFDV